MSCCPRCKKTGAFSVEETWGGKQAKCVTCGFFAEQGANQDSVNRQLGKYREKGEK